MRSILLGGTALAVFVASPAVAGQSDRDSVLRRLDVLEAEVGALKAENADLHRQLDARQPQAMATAAQDNAAAAGTASGGEPLPLAGGQAPAAPVAWTVVPEFRSPDGSFTFKPRGILDLDYAAFLEEKGGYDFSNGTQARRGRFGFDGRMFGRFAWRLEAEYVGGDVSLLDAYIAYTAIPRMTIALGQLKVPAGLEADSSDSFNEFMERGMAVNAFGAVGGDRRIGLTFAYADPAVTATAGLYGANESISRNPVTPDEVWGVNGRVTYEPVNEPGRLLHLGASAYHVMNLAGNSVTLADRPGVRVDGGFIESVVVPGANPPGHNNHTGADNATFLGLEAAGVYGPVSIQAEYSRLHVRRYREFQPDPALDFDGFYLFGSVFLTGESRSFQSGTIDRLRPRRPFDPARGDWGAWEVALRYDHLNLTDRQLSPLNHAATAWTAAVNWYVTDNMKFLFNVIRFKGENSPLVEVPAETYGTKAKGDAFAGRLHLDF